MFVSHTKNFIWKNYLSRYVLVFQALQVIAITCIPTGAEKKTRTPDEEVNWTTAIHEAGHTIIGMETPTLQKHVYKVTIKSRNQSLGHVSL